MANEESLGRQFEEQRPPHFMVMPYTDREGNTGHSKILNMGGRHTVLAWMRGTKVPFYLSTGLGGKENVESGKWYPHFGKGEDGWINKADQDSINRYYDSRHLKRVANWLNDSVGDTRGNWGLFGDDSGVPAVDFRKGPHIDAINADLNPISHDGDRVTGIKNIQDTLNKIHQESRHPTQEERIQDGGAHILLKKHAEEHPDRELGLNLP
jgi:hypothetical protein